jgi:sortase A
VQRTVSSGVSVASPLRQAQRRRRRSRRARVARVLAVLLIAGGALALADAIVTLVWQEPFSALYAQLRQDDLSGRLHELERAPVTPVQQRTLASLSDERARISYLAREAQRHAADGSPVGRISIARIGVSFVVVAGTDTEALQSGPGVYPQTHFPGQPGTTAIAGHRTTYLAPFRHIDALRPGDEIVLAMPYARFTYTVTGRRIVQPTDVQAAEADVGYSRLVLSACTPLFSAAKRLLVYARLRLTLPEGAARRLPGGALAQPISEGTHGPTPAGAGSASGGGRQRLPSVLEPLHHDVLAPLS